MKRKKLIFSLCPLCLGALLLTGCGTTSASYTYSVDVYPGYNGSNKPYRLDFEEDPLMGKDEIFKDDTKARKLTAASAYLSFFPEGKYTIANIANGFLYYGLIMTDNGEKDIKFFDRDLTQYIGLSMMPGVILDGIISQGTHSYILCWDYFSGAAFSVDDALKVLKAKKEQTFDIYFGNTCIYFLSKETGFDKSCLSLFDENIKPLTDYGA
ncbi:MAG: hypothetical protein LKJ88_07385 [Bacilli bacterium]|jgi:hypothetical protein|nr:hypothetical protein [Bacilli bacterium]